MADGCIEGILEALVPDTATGADPPGGVGLLPDLVDREPGVESLSSTGGVAHPAGPQDVDVDDLSDAGLE